LVGLGAFHGINPAMGWLFAVGLGLQHKSRSKVVWALIPIGLGHALSIGLVVAVVVILRDSVNLDILQLAAAAMLIAFGAYRLLARHRPWRTSMQARFGDLVLWSFLMATAHGAGLMLLPVLLNMPDHSAHATHAAGGAMNGAAATAIHSAATLVTTAVVAIFVYEWIGLAFLRRGWINLDWIWAIALVVAGTSLLIFRFVS
jgi:hypothetical protein